MDQDHLERRALEVGKRGDNNLVLKRKTAMRLALLIFSLGLSGATVTTSDRAEANNCSHCYKLESKCRRESKGQANCDAVVARCLRQCRKGG